MKKLISSIVTFVLIITINIQVIADDLDEEIDENELENILNVSTNVEDTPKINSRVGLIYDRTSGKVIFEKNGYTKRAMASTTKIMTAIVVLENANLTDTVEISRKAGRNRRIKVRAKSKR